METTLYIYLALYIAALIWISWWISRYEGSEGFLIADRSRRWWTIGASKFAGAIGVGYFVAYTGYAYEYGLGVYLILLGLLIGYTLFGLWAAPRLYAFSREKSFYTQGDFVAHKTRSDFARRFVNVIANIIIFSWLMVGIVGGAKIISHFGLMSYELALLATVLVIMSYILLAGFRAVLVTDIFQSVIIFVLMVMLTWIIIRGAGIGEIFSAQTGNLDLLTALGFFIFGTLSVFSYANFYQLVYAAENKRAAAVGLTSSIIPIVFIATLLLMIGMYMALQGGGIDTDLVFIEALTRHLPVALLPVGIVLFFAGLMSSADTNMYTIASHYVLSGGSKQSPRSVYDIRVAIVVLGTASIVIGYFFRDIVDVTLIAAGLAVTLSTAMIYLIAGGANQFRFIGSAAGGILGLVVGIAALGLNPTVVLTTLAGGLLGLLYNGWFLPQLREEHTLFVPETNTKQ